MGLTSGVLTFAALSLVLVAGGGGVVPGPAGGDATTQPITYYVTTTGNDRSSCAISAPCLTIQAVVNKVPRQRVRHPVTINVGAGSFKGAVVTVSFDYIAANADAYDFGFYLKGTMVTYTPTVGPSSGAVSSFVRGTYGTQTWGSITRTIDGGHPAWVVNELRGKFLVFTGGTGAGEYAVIYGNTTDTVTAAYYYTASTLDNTTTWAIQEPGTIINDGFHLPLSEYLTPTQRGYAYPAKVGFQITTLSDSFSSPVGIQGFKFVSPVTGGVAISGRERVWLRENQFVELAGSTYVAVDQTVEVAKNYATGAGSSKYFVATAASRSSQVNYSYNVTNVSVAVQHQGGSLASAMNSYGSGGVGAMLYSSHYESSFTGDRLEGLTDPSGAIVLSSYFSAAAKVGGGGAIFKETLISGSTGCGLLVRGDSRAVAYTNGITGTGNAGGGICLEDGGEMKISTTTSVTGAAGDVKLDGVAYTYAAIRALVPKSVTSAVTKSRVWEP